MNLSEVNRLAQYNSEVSHGLLHTEAQEVEMRELQRRFDNGEYKQPQRKPWWERIFSI